MIPKSLSRIQPQHLDRAHLVADSAQYTVGVTTTWHFGKVYEWDGSAGTSYYFFGGQRVAMRDSSGVSYIHGDHLTSATNTTGAETSGAQYYCNASVGIGIPHSHLKP